MRDDENRTRQILAGAAVFGIVAVVAVAGLIGWLYLPGLWGEWLGTLAGVMATPFFLEASFLVLGMVLVVLLNSWRRSRAGDDFVYLEEGDGDLPDYAKWAVFPDRPLKGVIPSLREQAEGALAIDDHESAAECFAAMNEDELKSPEVLELRLQLAKATGRQELVGQLETELSLAMRSVAEPMNTTR